MSKARITLDASFFYIASESQPSNDIQNISGFHRDDSANCWVIPRKGNYDLIIEEFGKDSISFLDSPKRDDNKITHSPTYTDLQQKIKENENEISLLNDLISVYKNEKSKYTSDIKELNNVIATLKEQINVQIEHHQNLTNKLERNIIEKGILNEKCISLQAELEKQHSEGCVNYSQAVASNIFAVKVKEVSIKTSNHDLIFMNLIDEIQSFNNASFEIGKKLESILIKILANTKSSHNNTDKKIQYLIEYATSSKILDEDGKNLAHFIRQQRNISAHRSIDSNEVEARSALSILTASLLWPKLSSYIK